VGGGDPSGAVGLDAFLVVRTEDSVGFSGVVGWSPFRLRYAIDSWNEPSGNFLTTNLNRPLRGGGTWTYQDGTDTRMLVALNSVFGDGHLVAQQKIGGQDFCVIRVNNLGDIGKNYAVSIVPIANVGAGLGSTALRQAWYACARLQPLGVNGYYLKLETTTLELGKFVNGTRVPLKSVTVPAWNVPVSGPALEYRRIRLVVTGNYLQGYFGPSTGSIQRVGNDQNLGPVEADQLLVTVYDGTYPTGVPGTALGHTINDANLVEIEEFKVEFPDNRLFSESNGGLWVWDEIVVPPAAWKAACDTWVWDEIVVQPPAWKRPTKYWVWDEVVVDPPGWKEIIPPPECPLATPTDLTPLVLDDFEGYSASGVGCRPEDLTSNWSLNWTEVDPNDYITVQVGPNVAQEVMRLHYETGWSEANVLTVSSYSPQGTDCPDGVYFVVDPVSGIGQGEGYYYLRRTIQLRPNRLYRVSSTIAIIAVYGGFFGGGHADPAVWVTGASLGGTLQPDAPKHSPGDFAHVTRLIRTNSAGEFTVNAGQPNTFFGDDTVEFIIGPIVIEDVDLTTPAVPACMAGQALKIDMTWGTDQDDHYVWRTFGPGDGIVPNGEYVVGVLCWLDTDYTDLTHWVGMRIGNRMDYMVCPTNGGAINECRWLYVTTTASPAGEITVQLGAFKYYHPFNVNRPQTLHAYFDQLQCVHVPVV